MSEKTAEPNAASARDVIAYLRDHPDFFQDHENLLHELVIPHNRGDAVSLVERQLDLLREQKKELQRQMQHIAQVARSNESLLERIQALILDLLEGDTLDDTLAILYRSLRDDFHADSANLRLIDGPADRSESVAANATSMKLFGQILGERKPVCGYLSPEQRHELFGDRAQEIASGVLIPLAPAGNGPAVGLLAIGSVDPRRYHAEMGTVFVNHLGILLTRLLQQRMASRS